MTAPGRDEAARGEPYNLATACLRAHAEHPATASRPAFSFVDGEHVATWTYAEAWVDVQRIGRGLRAHGLVPGDRVLIRLPHSPAYAFAFFGANAAGLVPIPASPQLTADEAAFLAADAEASALIADEGGRVPGFTGLVLGSADLDALDGPGPLPETRAEDPAYLQYTSGTTARPKGVLHAQRVLRGRTPMHGDAWQGLRPDDVTMHAGTLNWSYTLGVGLMDPWVVGAHAMLVGGSVEPGAWPALLARHRVTVFTAVPTVYRQLLKYGRPEDADLAAFRHGLCAGEALSPAVAAEWAARVQRPLYEALGMTEVSTYVSSGPGVPVRTGSPGRAQPGRRIAILDEEGGVEPMPAARLRAVPLPGGDPVERAARSGAVRLPGAGPVEAGLLALHRSDPGLMLGYWRRPEEQAAVFRGEWFVGGDRAAIDADGYVWFHGRADDVIKSFGYRLSPVEIEATLSGCSGVAEVAVVGLDIDAEKTLVVACVVPQPGEAVAVAALHDYASVHLAAYKQPHEYRIVESLPRTANGKVQRALLREQLRERLRGG